MPQDIWLLIWHYQTKLMRFFCRVLLLIAVIQWVFILLSCISLQKFAYISFLSGRREFLVRYCFGQRWSIFLMKWSFSAKLSWLFESYNEFINNVFSEMWNFLLFCQLFSLPRSLTTCNENSNTFWDCDCSACQTTNILLAKLLD